MIYSFKLRLIKMLRNFCKKGLKMKIRFSTSHNSRIVETVEFPNYPDEITKEHL